MLQRCDGGHVDLFRLSTTPPEFARWPETGCRRECPRLLRVRPKRALQEGAHCLGACVFQQGNNWHTKFRPDIVSGSIYTSSFVALPDVSHRTGSSHLLDELLVRPNARGKVGGTSRCRCQDFLLTFHVCHLDPHVWLRKNNE